jgi:predicted transcriptional regulator
MVQHKNPDWFRRVKGILQSDGPVDIHHLEDKTGLKARTIRYYIRQLDDEGRIRRKLEVKDGRKILYMLIGQENKAGRECEVNDLDKRL